MVPSDSSVQAYASALLSSGYNLKLRFDCAMQPRYVTVHSTTYISTNAIIYLLRQKAATYAT